MEIQICSLEDPVSTTEIFTKLASKDLQQKTPLIKCEKDDHCHLFLEWEAHSLRQMFIQLETIQKMYEPILRRLKDVLRAHGGKTA